MLTFLVTFFAGSGSGFSNPFSCQNDVPISIREPVVCMLGDGCVCVDDPELRLCRRTRDLTRPPRPGDLFLSLLFPALCVMRDDVALMPSWPTVACRISSRKVISPSLMSAAICRPVLMKTSRFVSVSDSHLSSFSPLMIAARSGVVEERSSFRWPAGASSLRRVFGG